MRFIDVFNPTSAPRVTELPLAARSGSLAGKTIGFLSNHKANAELLLESIERRLAASGVCTEEVCILDVGRGVDGAPGLAIPEPLASISTWRRDQSGR